MRATSHARLNRGALASAALALWAALAGAQTAVTPSGAGTEASPYQITQLGNLVWMRETVSQSSNAVYRLMNDIDASETAGWNGGIGFLPIGGPWSGGAAFRGAFDGGGHAIRGLVVGGEGLELGLFGVTGAGSAVKNLALVGASVAGSLYNGGIAGINDGGRISDCFVDAAIQGPGGCVVGENWAGTIERCYATGTVEAPDSTVGGIADYCMDGTVTQCYASVSLKGLLAGGLVRESPYGGSHSEVASSYWDLEASA